jgi:hypothetical protein
MVAMIDTLKLIVARSPNAGQIAVQCIRVARAESPALQARYNQVAEVALADPAAGWTPQERTQIAAHLDAAESGIRKAQNINIRVSAEDADTIRLLAEAQQMTVSEYVRRAALKT